MKHTASSNTKASKGELQKVTDECRKAKDPTQSKRLPEICCRNDSYNTRASRTELQKVRVKQSIP